jgi:ABC-2 type transport system permease protein
VRGDPVDTAEAQVFDLGYARYTGTRGGRAVARRAIIRDSVRTALGLGRGAGSKIAPWLLLGVTAGPALVLVVISAFAGALGADENDLDLPTFPDYYSFATVPIALFAAVVGPQLLCPDRRDRVLTLYAVRPVSPLDYAGSRLTGLLLVMVLALWLPETLLFVWNLLQADDSAAWLRDNWNVAPRSLAAGALVAAPFGTLALGAASLTTRRAYAAVITLAVLFVGSAVAGVGADTLGGVWQEATTLLGLRGTTEGAVGWIFGDTPSGRPHSGAVDAAWLVVLTAGLASGLLWQVRRSLSR